MTSSTHADVLIVGGGPAGSAAAIALARAGYDVILVERQPVITERVGEILPPSIKLPLMALGVWDAFLADGPLPAVGNCSAWGGPHVAHREFVTDPYGNGWHVDRPRFDRMLRGAAQRAGARVELGCSLVRAERAPGGGWDLAVRSASPSSGLRAELVIDASGRSRSFARLLGVAHDRLDAMVAYYGYVEARADAVIETFIEATRDGWWYAAPVPGGRSVVSFLTDACHIPRDRDLIAAIPAGITARLAPGARPAQLRTVAADSARLRTAAGDRWIAIGDAAATHDPLAAQGIDRALRSALRAAEAVSHALHDRPAALGEYAEMQHAAFDAYARMRRRFYALEQRWPTSPFWARRAETADDPQPQSQPPATF
ncbi:MAG TPA: FAD-dependent oxidoreductase [Kofleriaceae bacterium]|nr:FAD-dependent oxidoreductase [Kofleriaceae bacterium]